MTQNKQVTGWVGWIWFAAIMMIMVGFFNLMNGLIAVFKHDFYVNTSSHGLVVFNVTSWGWIHIVLGVIALFTGYALMRGAPWARVLAIIIVMLNGLGQLAIINLNPWWSIIVIAIDFLVLYAIIVHGDEAAQRAG
jgi:hypothetical protein